MCALRYVRAGVRAAVRLQIIQAFVGKCTKAKDARGRAYTVCLGGSGIRQVSNQSAPTYAPGSTYAPGTILAPGVTVAPGMQIPRGTAMPPGTAVSSPPEQGVSVGVYMGWSNKYQKLAFAGGALCGAGVVSAAIGYPSVSYVNTYCAATDKVEVVEPGTTTASSTIHC